MLKNFVPYIFT